MYSYINLIIFTLWYIVLKTESIKMYFEDSEIDCTPYNVPTLKCEDTDCDKPLNSDDLFIDTPLDSADLSIDCEGDQDCMELRKKRNSIDCESFDILFSAKYDLMRKSITVKFRPLPEYVACYEYYQVQLRRKELTENNCFNLYLLCVKDHVKSEVSPNEEWPRPPHEKIFCSEELNIMANSSSIVNDTDTNEKKKEISIMKIQLLLIPSTILLFIITIVMLKKYKPSIFSSANRLTSLIFQPGDNSEERCHILFDNIELLILHSSDAGIQSKILLLKDFLEKYASFKVITMMDVMFYNNIDSLWFKTQFFYKCKSLGDPINSSKRILLVEPGKALSQVNKNQNILDDIYCEGLHILLSAWSRCLKDYCHLFVLEFNNNYAERQFAQEFVPGVRYLIPRDLVKLCLNLSSCGESNNESLQQKLTTSLRSHKLMEHC
ncbi:uncharacterized protein [Parasteatoda tepidariorum]|uniref:uncharacterized protein isoform X2 n=1 Tax=Parasteatoda tepidariorum TaxID=114398 RepID=UPI001C71C53C|nr:uncharacterized protein LOC107444359 isoform X2 [Parasteatoda tepidariorum]